MRSLFVVDGFESREEAQEFPVIEKERGVSIPVHRVLFLQKSLIYKYTTRFEHFGNVLCDLTQKEKENIRAEYKDKYFREFEESGVKNLRIVLPSDNPVPE